MRGCSALFMYSAWRPQGVAVTFADADRLRGERRLPRPPDFPAAAPRISARRRGKTRLPNLASAVYIRW
jgi:hypothetical protein